MTPEKHEWNDDPMGRTLAPSEVEASSEMDDWSGRLLEDRYRIEELLGEGGMGAVYLAEHVKLGKKVAIKVIHSHFAGNGEVAERFAREAMTSARIEHANIAGALDYGTLPEGGAYLVMPFVRGRSLRDALLHGVRGWRFATEIGLQIADALTAAHAAGVVHRDLKPENVMLEPRDDGSELVKVLDFGIARVVKDEKARSGQAALTQIGTVIGTPGYMAPEQAVGETVDERADLYALGVVLWECIAGKQLFEGQELTAIVMEQLTSTPPRLATIDATVPPSLDTLIARLLGKSREDRPARATEVRDALRELQLGDTLERKVQEGALRVTGPIAADSQVARASTELRAAFGAGSTVAVAAVSAVTTELRRHTEAALRHNTERAIRRFQSMPPPARAGVAAISGGAIMASLLALSIPFWASGAAGYRKTDIDEVASAAIAEPAPQPGLLAPLVDALPRLGAPANSPELETLLHSDNNRERHNAAEAIANLRHHANPFDRAVSTIELARNCRTRRAALRELVALNDSRAPLVLDRLNGLPRRGCGFLRNQDCNRCLRRDLEEALSTSR